MHDLQQMKDKKGCVMIKLLQVICTRITYDGDNIGEEFEIITKRRGLSKTVKFNQKLKCGDSVKIDKVVYEYNHENSGLLEANNK